MTAVELELETLDAADLGVVDMLCQRAGMPEDAVLRIALTRLAQACEEGSLCLPMPETGLGDPARYAAIVGNASEPKPLILHKDRLYFHRHFHAERKLAEGFLERLRQGPVSCDLAAARTVLHEILKTHPLQTLRTPGKISSPLELTEGQKWALAASLRERIFLLSGGPGTGKTALTASLLRALIRLRHLEPSRIRLCAPTGRAAQRLQESLRSSLASLGELPPGDPDAHLLDIHVETLHRLLGYHPPSGRFARNPDDPLQADLVLLDEASMADAFTLSALVQALPPETTLILVGDADQLPAIESGSVLSELLPSKRRPSLSTETWKWVAECFPETAPGAEKQSAQETVPAVILNTSHRAEKSLQELAEAIQKGDAETVLKKLHLQNSESDLAATLVPLLTEYSQSLFLEQRVRNRTYVEWLQLAREVPGDVGVLSALMEFLNRERILTCARYGGLGCEHINALIQKNLEPLFETQMNGRRSRGFHGAPILITRNDAATGLSNGEIGIWLRGRSGLTAYFQHGQEWRSFPAAFLSSWELAFATTVHKSQGSECDAVLLVLSESGNRLLTREILYTAVTRARKSVKVFGSEVALREAVNNPLRRYSGLREYFNTPSRTVQS
jgi:exodeoxyribonuclease V alpha subunit